jgi:P-type Cu+ transporter
MNHLSHVPHPAAPLAGPYAWPVVHGFLAASALLALYFGALTALSGWEFTATEFEKYWYFILPLALGFGVQVVLFSRLRVLARGTHHSGTMVAASGTTSTAAMVSCCAHYLVNVAPVLGATGLVAFAAQFQVEFFWVGLAFSAAGIAFVLDRVLKGEREHARCAV